MGGSQNLQVSSRAPTVVSRGNSLPFAPVAPKVVEGRQTQSRVSILSADADAEGTCGAGVVLSRCCLTSQQMLSTPSPEDSLCLIGHLSTLPVVSSLEDDQFSFVMSRALMLTD